LSLASAGVPVLLYDRPHNRDVAEAKNIRRVAGWTQITEMLLK